MPHRIKEILLRPSMRVMTANTGIRPRNDPCVGRSKPWRPLIVTTGAQLADAGNRHRLEIRPMGVVTG